MVKLDQPRPWRGISNLIYYSDKLYYVNSQVFTNHNSADIYSYDFQTRTSRFEKRLFSQDSGTPTIIKGLLHWPYEDPRFSVGIGELEVTNGKEWQWVTNPYVSGFHTHAIKVYQHTQFLLMSDWKGKIYRLRPSTQQWELWYEHPTPPRRVSRITEMVTLDNIHYWALTARAEKGVKLLYNHGEAILPVPGFPEGQLVSRLAPFQGKIYAVNHTAEGSRVWRTDGKAKAQPIEELEGTTVYALSSSPTLLLAGGKDRQGGVLWQTRDGITWTLLQRFAATPIDVINFGDQIFMGTYSQEGGALWGTVYTRNAASQTPLPHLPDLEKFTVTDMEQKQMLQELEDLLQLNEPTQFRGQFLNRLIPLALTRNPKMGDVFSEWLNQTIPDKAVPLFGNIQVSSRKLIQWYLLYAIAINRHGTIPQSLIQTPWQSPANRAEKYIESSLAAAWAAVQVRQNDSETLQSLRVMKEQTTLPEWAQKDFEAALHALSKTVMPGATDHSDLLKQQAQAFQTLREQTGHFEGGTWNTKVDRWGGEKHQLMQALEVAFQKNKVPQSQMMELIKPDQVVNKGNSLFDQLLQHPENEAWASTADAILIYYWRGMHDYLFFVFQEERLIHSGWWYARE